MRHLVGSSLFSGLAAGLLFGCSLSTVGAMDPVEGGECSTPMQTKKAADGCTECTCDGGKWSCNSDACAAGCTAGQTKVAADGCNECSCGSDGKWTCSTDQKCPPIMQACKPGDTKLRDDGCATCTCDDTGSWACPDIACTTCTPYDKTTDGCTTCVCAADGSSWSCTGPTDGSCGSSQVCKPGDQMKGDCKLCTCNGDGTGWDCGVVLDCVPQKCTPGDVTPAGDGCNTCTCMPDGTLGCTMKACPACPPPAADGGMCPPQTVYAQNPMTKDCCAYKSKCEAPAGWAEFANPSCSTTTPVMCGSGQADCDGDPKNGCEADLLSSTSNCGACGVVCISPDGMMGKCNQGKCEYAAQPTCFYGGVQYSPGQTFSSQDGCNSCACVALSDGTAGVACTERACMCNPDKESFRKYVSTDAMKCEVLDYMCPEGTSMFGNECGCGCQQSTDCPNVFQCTPDPTTMLTNCDPALMARCPYSAVSK